MGVYAGAGHREAPFRALAPTYGAVAEGAVKAAAAVHQLPGWHCPRQSRSALPPQPHPQPAAALAMNTTPAAPAKSRLAPAFDVHLLFPHGFTPADAPRDAARGRAAAPRAGQVCGACLCRASAFAASPSESARAVASMLPSKIHSRPSTGDFREAEVAFRAHMDPPNEDASRGLGSVLWTRGEFDEALRYYSQAVRLGPWRAINWSQSRART